MLENSFPQNSRPLCANRIIRPLRQVSTLAQGCDHYSYGRGARILSDMPPQILQGCNRTGCDTAISSRLRTGIRMKLAGKPSSPGRARSQHRFEDSVSVFQSSSYLGEMRWRTAKMSWSPGSPPESAGGPPRFLFRRDFVCSVLYASWGTPIVRKESSVTASCLS